MERNQKKSQSIMSDNLLNYLPLQAVVLQGESISDKEAEVLYNLWKSSDATTGRIKLPNSIDPMMIMNLKNKGLIQNDYYRGSSIAMPVVSIDLTKKGKDVVQKMIFKDDGFAIDKQSVEGKQLTKVASKQKIKTAFNLKEHRLSNGTGTQNT